MIKKVTKRQSNSTMCFGCGRDNDFGLRMDFFELEDNTMVGLTVANEKHQSYPGTVHGGISATMLDEVIGRAIMCIHDDMIGTTLEMTTKYKKPVPYDVPLIITGRVVEEREKVYISEGEIILPDGTVAVTATGTYYKLTAETATMFGADINAWEVYPSDDDPTEIYIPEPAAKPVRK